jgi:hypothetical protein
MIIPITATQKTKHLEQNFPDARLIIEGFLAGELDLPKMGIVIPTVDAVRGPQSQLISGNLRLRQNSSAVISFFRLPRLTPLRP